MCVKESCETVLQCGQCDEDSFQQVVAKHPVLRAFRLSIILKLPAAAFYFPNYMNTLSATVEPPISDYRSGLGGRLWEVVAYGKFH